LCISKSEGIHLLPSEKDRFPGLQAEKDAKIRKRQARFFMDPHLIFNDYKSKILSINCWRCETCYYFFSAALVSKNDLNSCSKTRLLKQVVFFIAFFCFFYYCSGQTDTMRYAPTYRFPMDNTTKSSFMRKLNEFLNLNYRGAASKTDLMTMPLTDELDGIQANLSLRDPFYYKAYLDNLVSLSDTSYLLQLSYLGAMDGLPSLRASFEFVVVRKNDDFIFSSPLQKNTRNWTREKICNVTFLTKNEMDQKKAQIFAQLDSFYNVKINAPDQQTVFIQADNFPDALQLVGVNYKSDYAGYAYNSLSDYSNNKRAVVSGRTGSFPSYDPHDTWHEKLRTVVADSVINRPVDEGCAYLFGGSWGYSWNQVLDSFRIYVHQHPNADWVSLYKNGDKFDMGIHPNAIANILNALLVEKIQKEKGFSAVMELLSCGRREKGDANYFMALQKITGITTATFSKEIYTLLKS
jgi:hypothetical protein